jgi:predicted O-methyltransferase YrrM
MTFGFLPLLAAVIGFLTTLRLDVDRRKLSLIRTTGWSFLTLLDVICIAFTIAVASALLVISPQINPEPERLSPVTFAIVASIAALFFLLAEGRRQVQLQRPAGIVFAEWTLLFGFYQLIARFAFPQIAPSTIAGRAQTVPVIVLVLGIGGAVLAIIIPPFVKGHEQHRILDRVAAQGEFIQFEATVSTPECPHPGRWQMVDAQSAEIEVLDFLKALVITVKPDLIVETGTFIGHSAMKMAEGMKINGFGKIITVEYDPAVFAKAKQNIDASGLGNWIEYRNASSLDTKIDGTIDILFSDSDTDIRESEIRRFLPQIKPRGLVLVHDASSHFKVVRQAALRLEKEGLLSVVLLSTPRGLVIAQKREGRT